MSLQVQQTTTITADNGVLNVSELSSEVQQLIQHLDNWRQDEVDQTSQLIKTKAAINDIRNTIFQQLQQDLANQSEPQT
jgi:hypothetical protein